MDYKQKLIDWNSTDKYWDEVSFLKDIIGECSSILDYGCGTGWCAYCLDADGYDVNYYKDSPLKSMNYFSVLPNKDYNFIYFMHSFAHIPNPKEVLFTLRDKYPNATITVITPNKDWLDPNYNNDPTVIKHYTMNELKDVFNECGYEVRLIGQFGEVKGNVNERIFLQTK